MIWSPEWPGHAERHRPSLRGEVSLLRLSVERASQMVRLYRNWPTALADRLGLRRRAGRTVYRLKSRRGRVEFLARTNGCDVRTINEIWIGELYDRFLDADALRDRQVVIVDIGANCGYFAVYAGRRFPEARIVCFEPEDENRELARSNLALNGVDAEVHAEAVVAEKADTVMLNLSDDPRLHTTVAFDLAGAHGIGAGRYAGRTVSVSAIEVNEALAPLTSTGPIDLLKIDVEGLDLDLVEALDDRTLASILCIAAEVEDRDARPAADRLRQRGFRITLDAGLLMATRTNGADGTQ